MKLKFPVLIAILFFSIGYSQIPNGYYSTAKSSGYTLKTELRNIITNGHVDQGYGALYEAYRKSDTDIFYEKDNTVLDMYSENPNGKDAYNYNHNERNCGNYNSENDCYNREHIFPQGFFNRQTPMRTDIHHVVPSDGSVNGRRSNYPFGEVSSPSWTSKNGSKVGPNTFDTFSGTVFEPIDEFKGDIARMLFYFATRYENEVISSSWDDPKDSNSNPLNGTKKQVYKDWYIKLLKKWHTNDPVSQREIVRNNEAYQFQGNRNPFIDNPNYVSQIWGTTLSSNNFFEKNFKMYPNPNSGNTLFFSISQDTKVTIFNVLGKEVKSVYLISEKSNIDISDISKGVYFVQISNNNLTISKNFIKY